MNKTPTFLDDDHFHDECGVFGIYGHDDAAAMTALGLHALQHRGQESCGIVSFDGETYHAHRAIGLVDDTFGKASVIERLQGHLAIGHNRYSTSGDPDLRNVQPIFADLSFSGFAIAHNGNLTNAYTVRQKLVEGGSIFQSTSDSEVIVHLVATSKEKQLTDKIRDSFKHIQGAYSLVIAADNKLIGVRDPNGVRPLVLGKFGDSHILTSESCALDIIGAEYIRDIEPGEIIIIDQNGMKSEKLGDSSEKRFCIFEYVYFARPDSTMENRSVYETRRQIGIELAREAPAPNADLVVPVPDSGVPSAIGYSVESGIPFELGIIRNHYVGRTFIEPTDQIRHLGVKLKHNANRKFIEGKSIVLVDDSIVRGTTSRKIVDMLRASGVKEVHMRISSPPTKHSCFYGIDTPEDCELLANRMDVEAIRKEINVDTLSYVSIDGLYRAVGTANGRPDGKPGFCDACFTGDYPIPLVDKGEGILSRRISSLKDQAA